MAGHDSKSSKLLLCGDVCGRFEQFRDRMNKLHASKNGPFDAVLCTGNFFSATEDAKKSMEFLARIADSIALPVYFVAGAEKGNSEYRKLLVPGGGEVAPGIHYLGNSGISEVAGMVVAYVSGEEHPMQPVASSDQTALAAAVGSSDGEMPGDASGESAMAKLPRLPVSLGPAEHDACVSALAGRMERAADEAARSSAAGSASEAAGRRPWQRPAQPVDILITSEWPAGFHLGVASDGLPSASDLGLGQHPDTDSSTGTSTGPASIPDLGPLPPSIAPAAAAADPAPGSSVGTAGPQSQAAPAPAA